jgi:hypothetical protein
MRRSASGFQLMSKLCIFRPIVVGFIFVADSFAFDVVKYNWLAKNKC